MPLPSAGSRAWRASSPKPDAARGAPRRSVRNGMRVAEPGERPPRPEQVLLTYPARAAASIASVTFASSSGSIVYGGIA